MRFLCDGKRVYDGDFITFFSVVYITTFLKSLFFLPLLWTLGVASRKKLPEIFKCIILRSYLTEQEEAAQTLRKEGKESFVFEF